MPKKFVCTWSTDDLKRAYIDEKRTLKEMCEILGVKSTITVSKLLNERGISTNNNERLSKISKNSMSDVEFKSFLEKEYSAGKSMITIARELDITPSCVRKYFVKYGIDRRGRNDFYKDIPFNNPNWKGGKRKKSNGYIEIYCPDHPNANSRKCVYEHQLVMEEHIGRYIKRGEVIHHIDGNKSNNNIDNLLLLSNSEHIKLHALLKKGEENKKGGG